MEKVQNFISEKMYRVKDKSILCKNCGAEVSIGFNILQEECFEKYVEECIKESLCPKCLIHHKIDNMVDYDKVLLDTAKNMICVGVI